MYFTESAMDIFEEEQEIIHFFQEASEESKRYLKETLIDPIITVLEKSSGKKEYIGYGNEFLDANAEMLSKEFPTKRVVYPRKYVDRVLGMFGFTKDSLTEIVKTIAKSVIASDFKTITSTPSNIVHAVVLYYSDMVGHLQLRDSARQQLGLTAYGIIFNKYFRQAEPSVPVMTYTYMQLDRSWGLIKSENVMNWIGNTVETCFQFFRSQLSLNMSPQVLVDFMNRIRTSFNQNMKLLANKYHENLDKGNKIGDDLKGDEEYVETSSTTHIRISLLRLIRTGDRDYHNKGKLYQATAEQKNVRVDELYELAQKVNEKDIGDIFDLIFYVFIVKEGHTIDQINSSAYIQRITKFPTAIDRAISGKPVIAPFTKKYKTKEELTRAYICLLATFILMKINQVKQ